MRADKIIEILKYGIFGVATVILNLVLFAILKEIGLYYILANAIAYSVAVLVNFLFNKYFVFKKAYYDNSMKQLGKYVFMRLLSLGVDSMIFFVLVNICHFNIYVSRITLSAVLIIFTFGINKILIFR